MRRHFVLIAACLVLALMATLPAAAHESRDLGEIIVVFGWRVEPALAGEPNGPELFVYERNADGSRGDRIESEGEFEVQVQYGDQSINIPLEPAFRDPGHYVADLIPTLPGDYTFIVSGTVEGVTISETFTSADGEFSSILPASDVQFPTTTPSLYELMLMIQDLQAQIDELRAAMGS